MERTTASTLQTPLMSYVRAAPARVCIHARTVCLQTTGVPGFHKSELGVPTVAWQVKDQVLPQLWCRLKLQLGFCLWPGNFHLPWTRPKKKMQVSIMLT